MISPGTSQQTSGFCSSDGCVAAGATLKSSFCNGGSSCVTAGAVPVRSSFSFANGDCLTAGAVPAESSLCQSGECLTAGAVPAKSSFSQYSDCLHAGVTTDYVVKSSFSTGVSNCLHAGATAMSSFTEHGGSVAVTPDVKGHLIAVTDSKSADGTPRDGWTREEWAAYMATPRHPVLFTLEAWDAFITGIKNGEFPVTEGQDRYPVGDLLFDTAEWEAFILGVRHVCDDGLGEFDLDPELQAELASTR